ncbi:MAG TPA: zf-TFIIB domain-containing protein [Roseateles sp.]|nr:zf-TFIIB domain-containing protein [Roseateles sp.]
MKCPTCPDATLVMADRQGIEIDYCPQCRGVWLDRGELDKLIERSMAAQPAARPAPPQQQQPQGRPDFVDSDYHKKQYGQHGHYRKKSWLSDFFD